MSTNKFKKIVKRIRFDRIIGFIVAIAIIIFCWNYVKTELEYTKSDEYKLLGIGYNIDIVEIMLKKLSDKDVGTIKNSEYIIDLDKYVTVEGFVLDNLPRYKKYAKKP